jgi:hypothetical protein
MASPLSLKQDQQAAAQTTVAHAKQNLARAVLTAAL